jgi:hypothetical protein
MKPLFVVLYTVASAVVLLGQSPHAGAGIQPQAANGSATLEERITSLPKRFPPEFYSLNAAPSSPAWRLVPPLRAQEPRPLI